MSEKTRQVGRSTVAMCYQLLIELRKASTVVAQAPEGYEGEWRAFPDDLSLAAFTKQAFSETSVSTIRNWANLLMAAGLRANVGTPGHSYYVVRVDNRMTVAQLERLLNNPGDGASSDKDARPSADEAQSSLAPASTELTQTQAGPARFKPAVQALTGPVEHPLVTVAETDAILARAEKTARLLQELKERRAAEPELRAQLAAAEELIKQYEQRIAEMTAELESARSTPALPDDVVRLANRIDGLLSELSDPEDGSGVEE